MIVVIKIGGNIAKESAFLQDLAYLGSHPEEVIKPLIVHGGGGEVNSWLGKLGIGTSFAGGIRITDRKALFVVIAVLCGLVNKQIVSSLLRAGVKAIGISGIDAWLLKARGKWGLGYVGEVEEVNPAIILGLLDMGYTPVIAPTGLGEEGPLNVNGDIAASQIAISIKAGRLIFLTDTNGVLDKEHRTIPYLDKVTALRLIREGVISSGMVTKLKAGFEALSQGIPVSIISGKEPGALIKEIKEPGRGTILK